MYGKYLHKVWHQKYKFYFNCCYTFQGQTSDAALAKIREAYWPVLRVNWRLWTPLQYINVKYIPQQVNMEMGYVQRDVVSFGVKHFEASSLIFLAHQSRCSFFCIWKNITSPLGMITFLSYITNTLYCWLFVTICISLSLAPTYLIVLSKSVISEQVSLRYNVMLYLNVHMFLYPV